MGIRSEVGIAVRAGYTEDFEKYNAELIDDCAPDIIEDKEGKLYLIDDVKWYRHDDPLVGRVYEWAEQNSEHILIVEACYDYPQSDEGDYGHWNDNPFNLCRDCSVSIYYTSRES